VSLPGAAEAPGSAPERPAPLYTAVGIPQGIVADPASRSLAGAVRRRGELVSLSQDDYDLWASLLTPTPPEALAEIASLRGWSAAPEAVRGLVERELVVELGARSEPLLRLRPIPRAAGGGNLGGPFRIGEEPSLAVDAVTVMLWWELDGATSLGRAVDRVAAAVPELARERLEALAAGLVLRLAALRLIHLDLI
jgi:hypothetical protein